MSTVNAHDDPRRAASAAHTSAPIAAGDPRPRTEVWEQRLTPHRWFLEWPAALRERLLAAIVEDEHAMVTDELKDLQDAATSTREPDWRWEREDGHLYPTVPSPSTDPDIDAYLEEAHQRIAMRLRRIEAGVAITWLVDIIVSDEYPDRLRRIADEVWRRYGDRSPAWALPPDHEHTVRLADKIRAFAKHVYPPGARQPEVPQIPLPEPVPVWFDAIVWEAFPDNVPQQVDVSAEPLPDGQEAPDAAREAFDG